MSAKKAKKKKHQLKEIKKKNKRIYLFLFVIGCLALILTILLYSVTIINAWTLVWVFGVSGFIGFLIDYKRYMFSYDYDDFFGYIGAYLQNTMFVGGVVGLLFLASNYYLAESNTKFEEYQIIERRSRTPSKSSNKQPVLTIIFEGRKKEFIFHHRYLDDMNKFKTVSLESVKGFWGFNVILGKKPNK